MGPDKSLAKNGQNYSVTDNFLMGFHSTAIPGSSTGKPGYLNFYFLPHFPVGSLKIPKFPAGKCGILLNLGTSCNSRQFPR